MIIPWILFCVLIFFVVSIIILEIYYAITSSCNYVMIIKKNSKGYRMVLSKRTHIHKLGPLAIFDLAVYNPKTDKWEHVDEPYLTIEIVPIITYRMFSRIVRKMRCDGEYPYSDRTSSLLGVLSYIIK